MLALPRIAAEAWQISHSTQASHLRRIREEVETPQRQLNGCFEAPTSPAALEPSSFLPWCLVCHLSGSMNSIAS